MTEQQRDRERRRERREKALHTESLHGIDLSEIDRDDLTPGEDDVYAVYVADLGDNKRDPAPLIVGLMYGIQEKYGESVASMG